MEPSASLPKQTSLPTVTEADRALVKAAALTAHSRIRVRQVHLVGGWRWTGIPADEKCGICSNAFEVHCNVCDKPGESCPPAFGACGHIFHLHCIGKQDDATVPGPLALIGATSSCRCRYVQLGFSCCELWPGRVLCFSQEHVVQAGGRGGFLCLEQVWTVYPRPETAPSEACRNPGVDVLLGKEQIDVDRLPVLVACGEMRCGDHHRSKLVRVLVHLAQEPFNGMLSCRHVVEPGRCCKRISG